MTAAEGVERQQHEAYNLGAEVPSLLLRRASGISARHWALLLCYQNETVVFGDELSLGPGDFHLEP
jgi:hypothetical protein